MLSIVSLLYFGTGIDLCMRGQVPLGVAFFLYAGANVCLILTIK